MIEGGLVHALLLCSFAFVLFFHRKMRWSSESLSAAQKPNSWINNGEFFQIERGVVHRLLHSLAFTHTTTR
jgi:hypothetical protein